MPRAGHDIGAGLEVGMHGVEARAAMDPGSRPGGEGGAGLDASFGIDMPNHPLRPSCRA